MAYKDLEKKREYHRKYFREWRIKRGDEYRKWHNEYEKKLYKNNYTKIYQKRRSRPYEKLAASIRTRIQGVVKKGYKSASTEELLGCTSKELKIYLQQQFKERMTWENYGFYGWHIDHKIPLSSFDLTKREEQKKAFHYTNLQPLWAKENMSKGAKLSY